MFLGIASLGPGSLGANEPDVKALMKDITVAFQGVEKGLANGDAAGAREHGGRLAGLSRRVRELSALNPEPAREAIEASATRIAGLGSEIASLSAKGDLPAAAQAFEDVRAACVTCHLRVRGPGQNGEPFPARGNTLHGRVRVLARDGTERSDHSGVVVFLDGLQGAPSHPPPLRRPVISQKDRRFSPRMLPILRGATVDFPNDDTIFHNVFSLCQVCPFDLDIYEPGKSRAVTFEKPGLVRIYCNIHPDMVASILILNHPYFTVTDRDGFFVITGAPDGACSLRTWQELGGASRQDLSLPGAGGQPHSIQIREERETLPPHRNKFGKPYAQRYR